MAGARRVALKKINRLQCVSGMRVDLLCVRAHHGRRAAALLPHEIPDPEPCCD